MATYQERLAEARILFPAATSPDDPRVVAAAEERLRSLGYDQNLDTLWLGGDNTPTGYPNVYRPGRLVSLADL